jgi:hypothetical protein
MRNSVCMFILLLMNSFTLNAFEFSLEERPEINKLVDFKASELCAVSENTKNYLQNVPEDKFAVHAGSVFNGQVTLERVSKTLDFICKVYRTDVREKRQSRLHDKKFIINHFDFYRWIPDIKTARLIAKKSDNKIKSRMLNNIPKDKIFLTKYYTKLLDASEIKTAKYNQALYQLPSDEDGLSLEQARNKKDELIRYRYSRQEIIAGSLLNSHAVEPLIWLTEEALHDVLLQGTGVVNVGGNIRYFNVHRNNGVAYDYALGKREQSRYWYFIEVPSIMGYGNIQENKIPIYSQVTFAGNVKQLGLGKLFMVSYERNNENISRMGVLADQGGAFDGNLFQLDMLVDSYKGWSDYHKANKHLPDYANAWLMLVK